MIDLHCHILPYVDDGSTCLEESLDMAAMAADTGVTDLVCTPHLDVIDDCAEVLVERMGESFALLSGALRETGIPLRIHPGAEIFFRPETPSLLRRGLLPTWAGGRYLLVEFFFDTPVEDITAMLDAVAAEGYCPLVAHPERYEAVKRAPEAAYAWYRKGYLLQLNKGSLLGAFGKTVQKAAIHLLNQQVVHTVASDAHRATARTPHMQELMDFLRQQCSPAYVKLLTEDNPRRILRNEAVPPTREILRPQKREKGKDSR